MRYQWMVKKVADVLLSTAVDTEVPLNYLVFHQNNSIVITKMISKVYHLKYILMVVFDNTTSFVRTIKIRKIYNSVCTRLATFVLPNLTNIVHAENIIRVGLIS